jgi:murein DD-endopeptidase MepM/ murein hydrolase activator NlpD
MMIASAVNLIIPFLHKRKNLFWQPFSHTVLNSCIVNGSTMEKTRSFFIQVLLSVFVLNGTVKSQDRPYFTYPLRVTPRLNANFGEMRPNHFHMGLDLFTLRLENIPLYAPADGYVSRIKIESGGFGNALYINHPNGTTTLYAHLNSFTPALEAWLNEEQYRQESWSVDVSFPPGRFPVKQGQLIGMSGNTGASAGPHVHFEIRETATEKCLNPLKFDFPLPDRIPPDLSRIAIYDRNKSTYEQYPVIHGLKKNGAYWTIPGVIRLNTDKITLALEATDRMSGVPNRNGIFETRLYEGEKLVGGFRLDSIGYDQTRYLNAHIDHVRRMSGGGWLQYILPLPGDRSSIYRSAGGRNQIDINDTLRHDFRLEVTDVAGNTSEARFSVQRSGKIEQKVAPSGARLHPGHYGIIDEQDLLVVLSDHAMYDEATIEVRKSNPSNTSTAYSVTYQVMRPSIPVHDFFSIRIRPDRPVPPLLMDRMVISRSSGGSRQVKKATPGKDGFTSSFRDFGNFQLEADPVPPVIHISGLKDGGHVPGNGAIHFSVSDNNSMMRGVRAEIDGRWIKCVRRGNSFTYRFDDRCPPGRHTLTIVAEDEAGNKSTRSIVFVR